MLRQTEKGDQSELGRNQSRAMRTASMYVLLVEGWMCGDVEVSTDLKGSYGRGSILGQIRHNILACVQASKQADQTGEAVVSSSCQMSDTCQSGLG